MNIYFFETKFIFLVPVLSLFVSPALFGDDSPRLRNTRGPIIERRRIINTDSPLTQDNNFFNYNYRFIGTTAQNINRTIKHFPIMTKWVESFLENDDNIKRVSDLFMTWGGLYCNMPELTGRKDSVDVTKPPYVLSLMFCSRFKEADAAAKAILEKEPDNYGAKLLLGLLAIYDEKNFPYLEQAFLMNPYKTILIFDLHLEILFIHPQTDWDFVHAYFMMLTKNLGVLKKLELPPKTANRLSRSFLEKYNDPEKPFPGYDEVKKEMVTMISIIRMNLSPEKVNEYNRRIFDKGSKTIITNEIR